MFGSSNTIRRLAGLVGIAGAFAVLVPVAQAASGFNGSPDAIDRAVAAQQASLGFNGSPDAIDRAVAAKRAKEAAALDAREQSRLTIRRTSPDVVDRAVRARELSTTTSLESMPDVLERTALAGSAQYQPEATTSSRFDWNEFGIGAAVGIGSMLLLIGLGFGVLVVRHGNGRVTEA